MRPVSPPVYLLPTILKAAAAAALLIRADSMCSQASSVCCLISRIWLGLILSCRCWWLRPGRSVLVLSFAWEAGATRRETKSEPLHSYSKSKACSQPRYREKTNTQYTARAPRIPLNYQTATIIPKMGVYTPRTLRRERIDIVLPRVPQ